MGSAETTHLFCDKSIYEAVQFGESKQKKDTGLTSLYTKRAKYAYSRRTNLNEISNLNSTNHNIYARAFIYHVQFETGSSIN